MKRPKTKAEVRRELEQQMSDYMHRGGDINQVDMGKSARDAVPAADSHSFDSPKISRTLVNNAVNAIESRRKPAKPPEKPKPKKPVRKLIYDEFGDPLRWEWVEE